MKRKELISILMVIVVSGIFSLLIATVLFNSPSKHSTKVPVAQAISSSFPDIKNDPNYNFFLNNKALDPTQPIQIGNSQNTTPFNGSP